MDNQKVIREGGGNYSTKRYFEMLEKERNKYLESEERMECEYQENEIEETGLAPEDFIKQKEEEKKDD